MHCPLADKLVLLVGFSLLSKMVMWSAVQILLPEEVRFELRPEEKPGKGVLSLNVPISHRSVRSCQLSQYTHRVCYITGDLALLREELFPRILRCYHPVQRESTGFKKEDMSFHPSTAVLANMVATYDCFNFNSLKWKVQFLSHFSHFSSAS